MIIATYTIGLLLRPSFRRCMEIEAFYDKSMRYKEIKGVLESTFLIDAEQSTLKRISDFIDHIQKVS